MSEMEYSSEKLRTSGKLHNQASEAADSSSRTLANAKAGGNPFGLVNGGAALSSVVGRVSTEQARGAKNVAHNQDARVDRSNTTAKLGDDLTAESERIVRQANATIADNIKKGM